MPSLAFFLDTLEEFVVTRPVALTVARSEPESTLLTRLDVEQLYLTIKIRILFPWMVNVQEMHFPRPQTGMLDGTDCLINLTSVKVGNHEDNPVAPAAGPEILKGLIQVCLSFKIHPTDKIEDPLEPTLPFQWCQRVGDGFTNRIEADPVMPHQTHITESDSKLLSRQPLFRKGLVHRRTGIDDNVDMKLLDLLIQPNEEPIEAGIELPVDRPVIIPRRVVTESFEFTGESRRRRRLNPLPPKLLALLQAKEHRPQSIQELWIKQLFIGSGRPGISHKLLDLGAPF